MAGRSAVLAVRVLADASNARRGLGQVDQAAGKTATSVGSKFRKMAGVVAGAFAFDKVAGFLKDSVQGYQDHLTVLKQTQQVIKTTGSAARVTAAHVGALADSVEAYTGVDGDAIQTGANMLLTFTNIRNGVGKTNQIFDQGVKIVTDMSAALGTDMKAQAIQVGKALNDPIKGVSALSKVGVSFTAQQKAQIATLVKSGKTMDAQKIILRELSKEFGGTAHKIETPTQAMMVQVHALQDQIGAVLLPVITKLMRFLTTKVLPTAQKVIGFLTKHKRAIGIVLLVLTPFVAAWAAYAAVSRTVAIAQAVLNAVMAANPIVLVVAALAALIAALVLAYTKSETFRAIVTGAFGAFGAVATVVRAVASFFTKTLPAAFATVVTSLRSAWNAVVAFLRTWGPRALLVLVPFIGIPLLIYRNFAKIKGWLSGVWTSVVNTARSKINSVVSAVTGLPARIAGLATKMASAGARLLSSLMNGIKGALRSTGTFVTNLGRSIVNAIIRAINHALSLPIKLPRVNTHIPGVGTVGGQTLLPAFPLLGWSPTAWPAVPRAEDLVPGFTLHAADLFATTPAPLVPASRERAGDTYNITVKADGVITDPDAVARKIETLLAGRARRLGRA